MVPAAPLIAIDHLSFTVNGQPATYAGQDAFALLARFKRGEDIGPFLRSCQQAIGEVMALPAVPLIPVLRCFSVLHNLDQIQPSMYADFYLSVSALTDYLVHDPSWRLDPRFGFYPDWEALADVQTDPYGWGWTAPQKQDHWQRMQAALRGRTPFLTLGNEGPKNGFDSADFSAPPGFLASKGSNLGGDYPPPHPWQVHKYHPRRDGIKGIAACGRYIPFVVGGDPESPTPWPPSTVPVVTDEWLGAADADDHGRRSQWPDDFYRAGFDSAAWGAGGVFHSDCGLQAQPYSPRQLACAQAYFMGLSKADPAQRFQGSVR